MKVTKEHITLLQSAIGSANVYTDENTLEQYAQDATEKLYFLPQVVLKPRTTTEVSRILQICHQYLIPVTPRGGGTGVSGGALAYKGGVMLSMERFNSIIEIDEQNQQLTTEPGVITEVLQNAVKDRGWFFPPDPASKGSCYIGGNIAENSGGPKAVKYGVVKDYVLNLEVVLPTGEIIWTGANVLKNVTGYNLTQLMVGSEGTLGVITKIVLKLLPLPPYELLLLAAFSSVQQACDAVNRLFHCGIIPSALELMEADALKVVAKYLPHHIVPVHNGVGAHLLVEVDGNNVEALMMDIEIANKVLEASGAIQTFFADTAAQKEELWKIRLRMAEAVKADGYTIEEDTVVPRAMLAMLIQAVKELGIKHDFRTACYGHAGDGNLHIRIKKKGIENSWQQPQMQHILQEFFTIVHSLGGTITAEHGIGLIQKKFLNIVCSKAHIDILRGIKKVFDPNGILNPGKIFD